ncbi:hypothetical protein CEXT_396291 [Caerostris extrusa]|uniref:Uncharacterized protein n=1 Tax=Caerostris extrusa TaxID=172846 RepID=A0AAV4RCP9_CAEEX|nr:hypothetical protein CEXT_396291 [Caerostris extrusa]
MPTKNTYYLPQIKFTKASLGWKDFQMKEFPDAYLKSLLMNQQKSTLIERISTVQVCAKIAPRVVTSNKLSLGEAVLVDHSIQTSCTFP